MEALKNIQRVKTPAFLYTRIEAKIAALNEEKMPKYALAGLSFAFILLFGLNILVIDKTFSNKSETTTSLGNVYDLKTSNQLYND